MVLPIVPMFHANAWGLPYAALMAGASLVMPDRFLDGASLIELIESQRPTLAGAVPTIWNDVMNRLEHGAGHDASRSLRLIACGGSAVPVSLEDVRGASGVYIQQAWGMTETLTAGHGRQTAAGVSDERHWACGPARASPCAVSRSASSTTQATRCPRTVRPWGAGSSRPVDHRYTQARFREVRHRLVAHGRRGGHRRGGYVTLTDRAKTSSNPVASGSPRSSWRTC